VAATTTTTSAVTTTTSASPTLPFTGQGAAGFGGLSVALAALGGLLLAVTRSRRAR
jgi:hypothetical protein